MPDELTDQQIEFYRDNGFIVIENFLDPQGVRRMASVHR